MFIKKHLFFFALTCLLEPFSFLLSNEDTAAKSLISKEHYINDFEARLSIAKILARHLHTQEAARRLFVALLQEDSATTDAIIHESLPLEDGTETPPIAASSLVAKESQISDFEATHSLAQIFSRHQETRCRALKIYDWLLKMKPSDPELYLELGQLYINLKQQRDALAIFYYARSLFPYHQKLLVATAQSEAALGYAKKARDHFIQALELAKEEDDYQKTLIDYANGMMSWGDFRHAELIYRNYINNHPDDLDAYMKLAWSLSSEERYEEAEEILLNQSGECGTALLNTQSDKSKVLLALARLKFQEKKFDAALEFTETLLSQSSDDGLKLAQENLEYLQLKADILFMQYRYAEAIDNYERLKDSPDYRAESYIGIGRSLQRLGDEEEAQKVFEAGLHLFPSNIKLQYYVSGPYVATNCFVDSIIESTTTAEELSDWGSVYIQNGLVESALLLYQAAAERDPEYFPGMLGFAEKLSINFLYCHSLEIYEDLLSDFPENSKLMLSIARVTGWSKQYGLSIKRYNELLEMNPENPVLYREKARTALWGNRFHLGMATYDELLEAPATSMADTLIQQSIILEKNAKALIWNKRYIHSLDAYETLLNFSPGNEEGYFDYAQSYCILNLCDYSKEIYSRLLHIDPSHNLIKHASARNDLKWFPKIQNSFSYWREIGSGTFSQSQIARYRLDTMFEQPLSCRSHLRFIQQEYVENPFYNFKFYPAEGQSIEADCVFNEYASALVSATYKTYFNKFKSTITSNNWLLFNVNDYFNVLLSCNKVNEIYNYFSLKQAIQSINSSVKISSNINHELLVSGTCEYYAYNDHNNQIHMNLYAEYQFSDAPHIFKLIVQGDYRNTAHDTIDIVIGNTLVDVIHPYWTPIDYYSGSITFESRADYRKFLYCEAPQRYVDLKIAVSTDNVNNPGVQGVLEWKHEFERHWGFELKGLIHRSRQWNAEGAWGTMYHRF